MPTQRERAAAKKREAAERAGEQRSLGPEPTTARERRSLAREEQRQRQELQDQAPQFDGSDLDGTTPFYASSEFRGGRKGYTQIPKVAGLAS